MLIYNQAFDFYHTIFRMLQLTSKGLNNIQIEKIRILDFYMVFPWTLLDIPYKTKWFKGYQRILYKEKNSYDNLPNTRQMFIKMAPYQYQALKAIVAFGFYDKEAFENGLVKKTEKEIPSQLIDKIIEANKNKKEFLTMLTSRFAEIPLLGSMGLKARTGLMDFKYDETTNSTSQIN